MFYKYVRLWVLENPKKIPWDSKLKIIYNKNYGFDRKTMLTKDPKTGMYPEATSDPFYNVYFEHNTGSLEDGPQTKQIGEIDCKIYNSLKEVKLENVEIVKDWGKKTLKKIYVVQVLCPFDRIAVELAVRHYLLKIHKYYKFYGGSPFTNMRSILWNGKRVN